MGIIHRLAAFSKGAVSGVQAIQRDWSPYLVHFTSYAAMKPLRSAIKDQKTATQIRNLLTSADSASFDIVRQIAAVNRLRKNSPSEKDGIPECVCLTECNIPGLISHAERYGRFGFVFEKAQVFQAGGGPCAYYRVEEYREVAKAFKGNADPMKSKVFGRANVLSPVGKGKIQDFTHEREWRVFDDIDFRKCTPCYLLCPDSYVGKLNTLFADFTVIPIDRLFEWGA